MRYPGGKGQNGRAIAAIIMAHTEPGSSVYFPFCGALGVVRHIRDRVRYASDASQPMITLWQALQNGWQPPSYLSPEEYEQLKAEQNPHDPLTAFAGHGLSYAAQWFVGFAHNAREEMPSNYALRASSSLLQKIAECRDVHFACCQYDAIEPEPGSLIYCDPPYQSLTKAYSLNQPFDSQGFWKWCRQMAEAGHTVLVSEAAAPGDFVAIRWFESGRGTKPSAGVGYEDNRGVLIDGLFVPSGSPILDRFRHLPPQHHREASDETKRHC